jgi:hypothetical protein
LKEIEKKLQEDRNQIAAIMEKMKKREKKIEVYQD